jgi:hypothetical protein
MILIPILILQIFLFPIFVNGVMSTWVDQRRELALEEIAGHIGSSIQQIYYSLNHTTIQVGNFTSRLDTTPFIEGYPYRGNASLRSMAELPEGSNAILDVTLDLGGSAISATTSVTLGNNVEWVSSTLVSNSTSACVRAEKLSDGTIRFSFGALGV